MDIIRDKKKETNGVEESSPIGSEEEDGGGTTRGYAVSCGCDNDNDR